MIKPITIEDVMERADACKLDTIADWGSARRRSELRAAIESYAAEQVAAEREACASLCENDARMWLEKRLAGEGEVVTRMCAAATKMCAAAIRARRSQESATQDKAILKASAKESLPVPDLDHCPSCGGPADNGNDREYPPNPYVCSKCERAHCAKYARTGG